METKATSITSAAFVQQNDKAIRKTATRSIFTIQFGNHKITGFGHFASRRKNVTMSSGLENLPDDQIIQTIRELLGIWLDVLGCGGDIEKQLIHKKKFIHRLQTSPIAIETHAANEQHYEVPTEFFLRVLGKKLKYSCCYWPENCQSLDQAETYFFDLIFERAKLQDGLTVLVSHPKRSILFFPKFLTS